MEVYAMTRAIFSDNAKNLRVRMAKGYDGFEEKKFELDARQKPFDDPFSVLKAVVWGEIKLAAFDLYSLENNLIVMEILEAAKESAASMKTVFLSK
jgi:hypothetical protein